MASDQAPLLRPSPEDGDDGVERLSGAPSSPADPAISSSGGGGDAIDANNNTSSNTSSRTGYRTQVEQQNADDDELTDEDQDQQDEEQARDRDIQPPFSSSAASRTRRAPRETASCWRSKTAAFVVVAGVCLLAVGASFGAGARYGRAHPGRGSPSGGVVEREGDTAAAASPGDGLPLPQCYSTGTADPSIGAWRRCDGGARECSPIGNATLAGWLPGMESRYSRVGAE